jgi:S-adenosylmethionine hydrolase
VIALFTDFGHSGPYTGQMKAVLHERAPAVPVVDLLATAPRFDPRLSSYLLSACCFGFPAGTVFLCVVDPGVGSDRAPVFIKADGCYYVGPDNGLFSMIVRRSADVEAWEIRTDETGAAPTFHGRDIFAPVAAMLAIGVEPEASIRDPVTLDRPDWPDDTAAVLAIDDYGNVITGLRGSVFRNAEPFFWKDREIVRARTFSDVEVGQAIYYENSSGLIEIAVRNGSAAELFEARIGEQVPVKQA